MNTTGQYVMFGLGTAAVLAVGILPFYLGYKLLKPLTQKDAVKGLAGAHRRRHRSRR